MYGAILGDMIGAPYEFDRGDKTKEFPLFGRGSQFTDDSVMTVAVADALMSIDKAADDDTVHRVVSESIRTWGRSYPDAGYGARFIEWLFDDSQPGAYGSWGNGSAMRVSAAGWLYGTIEETRRYAKLTSEVTHDHPEGIKGAEATASAIFLARNGAPKNEIKDYIIREFGYDLSRTCDEIRPGYHHVESCRETVPEAITAFLEGNDFEDVIRTAVSLGGDCDTLTCIAGSIAEAFYGVPEDMKKECRKRLPEDMLEMLDRFEQRIIGDHEQREPQFHDSFLDGNVEYSVPDDPITPELLEDGSFLKRATEICNRNRTQLNMIKLARILLDSWVWIPCNAIMGDVDNEMMDRAIKEAEDGDGLDSLIGKEFVTNEEIRLVPDILQNGEDFFFPVFTTQEEMGEYGDRFSKTEEHFLAAINLAKNNEKNVAGIVINAFSEPFVIPREMFDIITGMVHS